MEGGNNNNDTDAITTPNVIHVFSEHGMFELCDISIDQQQQIRADELLALIISTSSDVEPMTLSCMGLKNSQGLLYEHYHYVNAGTRVFLCQTKDVTRREEPNVVQRVEEMINRPVQKHVQVVDADTFQQVCDIETQTSITASYCMWCLMEHSPSIEYNSLRLHGKDLAGTDLINPGQLVYAYKGSGIVVKRNKEIVCVLRCKMTGRELDVYLRLHHKEQLPDQFFFKYDDGQFCFYDVEIRPNSTVNVIETPDGLAGAYGPVKKGQLQHLDAIKNATTTKEDVNRFKLSTGKHALIRYCLTPHNHEAKSVIIKVSRKGCRPKMAVDMVCLFKGLNRDEWYVIFYSNSDRWIKPGETYTMRKLSYDTNKK